MLVGAFNQEKALVYGDFSMIVKTDGSFAALVKGDPTRWLLRPAAGGSDHK